jgi:hypothetical protein
MIGLCLIAVFGRRLQRLGRRTVIQSHDWERRGRRILIVGKLSGIANKRRIDDPL